MGNFSTGMKMVWKNDKRNFINFCVERIEFYSVKVKYS